MIPGGIPGGSGIPGAPIIGTPPGGLPPGVPPTGLPPTTVTRKPHVGPHLNITIIQGFPHGWNSAINPATGLLLGGGGVGGAINIDPTTGKPILDSNSTDKLRPNRQPGAVADAPMVDPTTGFPIGAGFAGGLPGMGGGSSGSTYEFDPTTVKVRGLKSGDYNISAFSLLHMVLNSLDCPIQCVIDRHGIFLMPIGHPFNFLNGKPAKIKSTDRWVLVGEW